MKFSSQVLNPSTIMLLIEGQKHVFGIPEGTQRFANEFKVRVAKVESVLIAELSPRVVGGLPGFLLTMYEAGCRAIRVFGPPGITEHLTAMRSFIWRDDYQIEIFEISQSLPLLCDGELLSVHPICCILGGEEATAPPPSKRPRLEFRFTRKEDWKPVSEDGDAQSFGPAPPRCPSILSFMCKTRPIPGQFSAAKAKARGLKPGPQFSLLTSGQSVIMDDGSVVKPSDIIEPEHPGVVIGVVYCPSLDWLEAVIGNPSWLDYFSSAGEGKPAVSVMYHVCCRKVLCHREYHAWLAKFGPDVRHCPVHKNVFGDSVLLRSAHFLRRLLRQCVPRLFGLYSARPTPPQCSDAILESIKGSMLLPQVTIPEYMLTYNSVPLKRTGWCKQKLPNDRGKNDLEGLIRKLWNESDPENAPFLAAWRSMQSERAAALAESKLLEEGGFEALSGVRCFSGVDYTQFAPHGLLQKRRMDKVQDAEPDDAKFVFPLLTHQVLRKRWSEYALLEEERKRGAYIASHAPVEVVVLGSGAMAPAKTRNVSAYLVLIGVEPNSLELPPDGSFSAVLFDCGEGTFGQLVMLLGDKERAMRVVQALLCVTISHRHADHHLGLAELIKHRDAAAGPLPVLAPLPVREWITSGLSLLFDPKELSSKMALMSCEEHAESPLALPGDLLLSTVFVHHCRGAFGMVLTGPITPSSNSMDTGESCLRWKVVYSGDTIPVESLIEAGAGATVAILEATFQNGFEVQAAHKRHSTFSQAVDVGLRMKAFRVVLSHFSQRYPKLPVVQEATAGDHPADPINVETDKEVLGVWTPRVCIAFDMMRLHLTDACWAPRSVAPLTCLFDRLAQLGVEEEEGGGGAAQAPEATGKSSLRKERRRLQMEAKRQAKLEQTKKSE